MMLEIGLIFIIAFILLALGIRLVKTEHEHMGIPLFALAMVMLIIAFIVSFAGLVPAAKSSYLYTYISSNGYEGSSNECFINGNQKQCVRRTRANGTKEIVDVRSYTLLDETGDNKDANLYGYIDKDGNVKYSNACMESNELKVCYEDELGEFVEVNTYSKVPN